MSADSKTEQGFSPGAKKNTEMRTSCTVLRLRAWRLKFTSPPIKLEIMTAAKVIEEMDSLPPDEQAKVIQHALELARHRQLSADELGELAERLAASHDPAEIIRLRSAMTRGFYGE